MKSLATGQLAGAGANGARRPRRDGIEVREEELGTVTAQRLFKMRCECGRTWFELELPRLIQCPACEKLNLVSI
jgi:hypothetical protein